MKLSKFILLLSGGSITFCRGFDIGEVINSIKNKGKEPNSNQNAEIDQTISFNENNNENNNINNNENNNNNINNNDNNNNNNNNNNGNNNNAFDIISTIELNGKQSIEDCINFNKFFKQFNSFNANSSFICCDGNTSSCKEDKIVSLNIDFSSYDIPKPDFSEFPILSMLKTLEFKNLYKIYDSSNNLPEIFFQQPSLETLNIINSNVELLPTNLNDKSPLKNINLSGNFITSFPYQFKTLQNLKKLDLNKNKISDSITEKIKDFPVLQDLNVSYNIMSGELYIPKNLISMRAVGNNFNKLTLETTSSNLSDLYLGANNFNDEAFNKIVSLEKLKNLFLNSNKQIESIPSKIKLLKDLQYLDLSATNLKQLPSTLFELSKLSSLSLSSNSQLNAKIINFGNKINSCDFSDIHLVCYQENTCEYLTSGNYTVCSEKDIQEIMADQKIQDDRIEKENQELNHPKQQGLSNEMKFFIIGIMAILLVIVISSIIFIILRKHFFKMYTNKEADIVIAPTIIRDPTVASSMISTTTTTTTNPHSYLNPNPNYSNFNNINTSNSFAASIASSSTLINPNSHSNYSIPSLPRVKKNLSNELELELQNSSNSCSSSNNNSNSNSNSNSSSSKILMATSSSSLPVLPVYSMMDSTSISTIPSVTIHPTTTTTSSSGLPNTSNHTYEGDSSSTMGMGMGHSTEPFMSKKMKKYLKECEEEGTAAAVPSNTQQYYHDLDNNPPPYSEI